MYLIELIIKTLTKKKQLTLDNSTLNSENSNYENCEHVFMPIDSTNETLSCTKCGILTKRSELKNKNFFVQDRPNIDLN